MSWKEEAENFCYSLGVSLDVAEKRVKEIGECGNRYFKDGHLDQLYFAIAGLVLGDAKNVLEIGTGFWESTVSLSALIPVATIYTVDIKRKKQKYPAKRVNIVFIQKNSFFLPSMGLPEEFDLIWIDGYHSYPVVAWDVMFSYNRLKKGGFIFMHDYVLGGKNDVAKIFAHVKGIISDEIGLLPSMRDNTSDHKIAWIRKLKEIGGKK